MAPPAKAPEIRALNGVRAVPPLLLVAFHFQEAFGYRGPEWWNVSTGKGFIWVEFFFLLSGFTLFYVYRLQPLASLERRAVRDFWSARISRLYPMHLATLFIFLGMEVVRRWMIADADGIPLLDVAAYPGRTAETFVSNLFLVQAWNIHDGLSWNGPAWFLSAILFLYLLFPLILFAMAPAMNLRALVAGAAGAVILLVIADTSGRGLDVTFHDGIYRGLGAFLIGAMLSAAFVSLKREHARPLPEAYHSLAQLGAVAGIIAALLYAGPARTLADLAIVAPMAALIFLLAFDRGMVARAATWRPLMILGEWSFAIYLIHVALIQGVRFVRQTFYPPPETEILGAPFQSWWPVLHWIELGAVILLSVLLGALLFRLVEAPSGRLLRRWLTARKPAAA